MQPGGFQEELLKTILGGGADALSTLSAGLETPSDVGKAIALRDRPAAERNLDRTAQLRTSLPDLDTPRIDEILKAVMEQVPESITGPMEDPNLQVGMQTLLPLLGPLFARAGKAFINKPKVPEGTQIDSFHGPEDKQKGMVTWHASPHEWESPDLDKVGTGEGHAAFGHGLYSAENKKTADWYFRQFEQNKDVRYQGKEIHNNKGTDEWYDSAARGDVLWDMEKDIQRGLTPKDAYEKQLNEITQSILDSEIEVKAARNNIWRKAQDGDDNVLFEQAQLAQAQEDLKFSRPYMDIINALDPDDFTVAGGGNMYKLDIPDEQIEKYLDWDELIDDQHPEVLAKLKKSDFFKWGEDYDWNVPSYMNPTGKDIMRYLSEDYSQPEISKLLNDLDIPGIKYLDGSSRRHGDGARNYVTFREDDITPLMRNETPLNPEKPVIKIGGKQQGNVNWGWAEPEAKPDRNMAGDFSGKTTKTAKKQFAAAQLAAMEQMGNKDVAQVSPIPDDFEGTVYLTPDGKAGFSMTDDGYVGHVFKDPASPKKGTIQAVMTKARGEGAVNLDAIDDQVGGSLVEGYKKAGATETDRSTWNPDYATEEMMKAFAETEPDYVGLDIGGGFPEYRVSQLAGERPQETLPRYTETPTGKPVKKPPSVDKWLTPENKEVQQNFMREGMKSDAHKWYYTGGVQDEFMSRNIDGPEAGQQAYEDFTGFGSALSPRSNVATEIKRSSLLNYMNKRGEDLSELTNDQLLDFMDGEKGYGHYATKTSQASLVRDYLETGKPGDSKNPLKAPSYNENKLGNLEPYTSDTRDYEGLTGRFDDDGEFIPGDHRGPTKQEYPYVENAQSEWAAELGLRPGEGQSAKWKTLEKFLKGSNSRNFTAQLNERVAKTATDTGLSEDEVMTLLANRDIVLRMLAGGTTTGIIADAMIEGETESTY